MDAAATIVLSTATYNSLVSGDVFGIELTADPTQNASLAFSGLTVQDGSGTTQITPAGISFPDFTSQTTAASPFNGGTVTAPVVVDESATSGYTASYSGAQINMAGGSMYISQEESLVYGFNVQLPVSGSITFGDSTTQTTAAVTFTGGTLSSIVAVAGSGGTSSLGTDSGGSISVTDLSATTTTKVTYSGITFSDSTTQTTAAVAPPSADVLTANAIASNVNYISGSSGTWVGNGLPSIAGLVSWGIYNVTDGLIAYSYSSGSTFYLASSISTSNNTVQISGSNSSFYVA
jgi:hypothetical protein